MLLQHSALYALARGIPGIINFLAIAIYTRLLTPDAYGQYAVVIAAVGLLSSVSFQWLRLGLLRFLPAHSDHPQALLSTILFAFLTNIVLTAAMGILGYFLLINSVWRAYIPLAVLLMWALSWFELNLEIARSRLAPLRYGFISMTKSVLALSIGTILVLQEFEASGPILGLLAGSLVSTLIFTRREWINVRISSVNKQLFATLLRYGLPLTATFALAFVVSSSDRFLLAWFLGPGAAGLYAPSYDLAQFSIGTLMTIINLAAYPLVVRALEQHGNIAAQQQLKKNALLLLGTTLPAVTGFIMCSTNIANVALGEAFRETAINIIPLITMAAFLAGFKAFYLDLSFQLGRNTMGQVWVALIAAGVNLILNVLWIPKFGLLGAAYATVMAYASAFTFSWLLGRRVFQLPALPMDSIKIALSSAIMALALWPTLQFQGLFALLGQISLGFVVYALSILILDVAGSRQRTLRFFFKKVGA